MPACRAGQGGSIPSQRTMESLGTNINFDKYTNPQAPIFRSFRDELVSKITDGINTSRLNTPYKPISKRLVAIKINSNPFLAKSNGEIELLYKDCVKSGSFAKFFWITNQKSAG